MIVNEPRELLMVLEHAHRYMDANGYPARSYPPSFATAELMKEPTVTVVSDLFDNPRRLTEDGEPYSRAHGTHGGVSRHHRNSETLCDECGAFIATLHRTKRREKRDGQLRAPRHADGHDPGARAAKVVRELTGPLPELPVRQRAAVARSQARRDLRAER